MKALWSLANLLVRRFLNVKTFVRSAFSIPMKLSSSVSLRVRLSLEVALNASSLLPSSSSSIMVVKNGKKQHMKLLKISNFTTQR